MAESLLAAGRSDEMPQTVFPASSALLLDFKEWISGSESEMCSKNAPRSFTEGSIFYSFRDLVTSAVPPHLSGGCVSDGLGCLQHR